MQTLMTVSDLNLEEFKGGFTVRYYIRPSDLQIKVYAAILRNEGITQTKICQLLNGHDKWFCKYCYQYANAWKRKAKRTFEPTMCKYQFKDVMRAIRWLDAKGIVYRVMTRVTDKWHSRGWDWMQRCFIQVKPMPTNESELTCFLGKVN
jgi:hypothetical protein